MTIQDVKAQFLANYTLASESTQKKYDKEIGLFLKVCEISDLEKLQEMNEVEMGKFYSYAKEMGWGTNTINQRLVSAKVFTKWCYKKKYIDKNFLEDVKLAKIVNYIHYTPTEEDCEKLLNYVKSHTKKKRLYLMLELLLNSGLRRFEICNLKIDDIDTVNNAIRVVGKGNKIDSQLIRSDIIQQLLDYISTERKEIMNKYIELGGVDLGYIFVSGIGTSCNADKKRKDNGNKVGEDVLYQQLKRYAKLSGMQNAEFVSPHSLRRRFGTSIQEKTGDIVMAQKALRHSSIMTTAKHYVDFDKQRLRAVVDNLYED